MLAALLGFAGVVLAALFGLTGVILTTRPSGHHADLEGLKVMVDELRTDRNDLRGQVRELETRIAGLEQELAAERAHRDG